MNIEKELADIKQELKDIKSIIQQRYSKSSENAHFKHQRNKEIMIKLVSTEGNSLKHIRELAEDNQLVPASIKSIVAQCLFQLKCKEKILEKLYYSKSYKNLYIENPVDRDRIIKLIRGYYESL